MADKSRMITMAAAINEAFKEEMRRDENIVMWGEDLVSSGGMGTTRGIYEEFGGDRILDTPISETAIVNMAAGAGYAGLRPVAHLMIGSFIALTLDGVFLKVGSNFQEWNYQGPMPVVIFTVIFGAGGYGSDHALSPEALLMHSPGLKIAMPSNAIDAKGLMKAALRESSPVVFLTQMNLMFSTRENVPEEEYIIPLGKGDIKREGKDITFVTYSSMVPKAMAAAEALDKEGIGLEVIDLRTLVPLDVDMIVKSVMKTGRLMIAHESMKRGGPAAEIAFRVNEAAPELAKSLKHPVKRLAAMNIALPHSKILEATLIPQVDDIVKTSKQMVA